jgi:hypothetical protein
VPLEVGCCRLQNCLLGLGIAVLALFSAPGAIAQCSGYPKLSTYERVQFIAGYYGERTEVYAQFLSSKGCERLMLDSLHQFGGSILYDDERTGYALVLLPKEKLLEVLDLPGIAYAFPSTDDRNYPEEPAKQSSADKSELGPVPGVSIPTPRVAMELSPNGPYFAAHEIGLDALREQHPEADGRGVAAVVLDEGLDLLHPAMRQARDANGKLVPKIADQVSYGTPEEDKHWVQLGDPIETQNGSFQAAGRTWTVASDGVYRFGVYRNELLLGPQENSHTKKLALAVGVLLDEKNNRVWVDTNGDGSFKDQRALSDYAVAHEMDWFGAKEGDDDNRIPFGVKTDSARHAVFITVADGGHGAGIAGSLAANRLTGGLYDGAAPGAQLIDARDSRLMQLPAILQLAARTEVGVISRSGGFARAGYEGNKEGAEDFQRHVAERMVAVYDKPMVCVCAADGLISVDDYVSGEMLRRNRQTSPPYAEAVHGFYDASRTWGLVNSVFAPSGQLNTESRYMPFSIVFADGKRHSYEDDRLDVPAPAGYWIGANESPTVPVVSGVLADLISEARREQVRYTTARLNQAIFASARIIPGIPIYEQSYGLIQADAAWNQLVKMATADDPGNNVLTSFTVSQMENGHQTAIDGYYHEVTAPQSTVDGEIWITRRGGYAGARAYSFALRGDDGTYTLLTTKAAFAQDKPAKIRFKAKVTSGFHVAFVELIDKNTGAKMGLVPLSLKVPDVPKVLGAGVERYEATMAPRRADTRLIYVRDEVQAVRFAMQIPYERDDASGYMPGLRGRRPGGKPATGEPVDAAHHVGPMESFESVVANENGGFQEVEWENRAFHAEYETPYDPAAPTVPITPTVTVTKYAVALAKSADRQLSVTNKLADIEGKVELYDATLKTEPVTGSGLHRSGEFERTLPANLVQWRVRITADSPPGSRAYVYLLNCSDEKRGCNVTAQQEISRSTRTLTVDKPQAGKWRIVVRNGDQVAHPMTYSIHEALLVSTKEPIDPTDSKHSSGTTWTVSLPKKESDAQYAAFRIAGTPGNDKEKQGLLIAMAPLDETAP